MADIEVQILDAQFAVLHVHSLDIAVTDVIRIALPFLVRRLVGYDGVWM